MKKLQEIVMNPLQNNPFLSRPTSSSRRHDRDRNERNVARRLEQALEVVCFPNDQRAMPWNLNWFRNE